MAEKLAKPTEYFMTCYKSQERMKNYMKVGGEAIVGQWHDYIAMNFHEIVFDPTPEDRDRILRESAIELVVDNGTEV
jgi:hypothetical protein